MSKNLEALTKEFIDVVAGEVRAIDRGAVVMEGSEHAEFYNSPALPGMLYDDVLISVSPRDGTVILMPENNHVPVPESSLRYKADNGIPNKEMFLRVAGGFVELTGLCVKPGTVVDKMPSFQHP